MVYSEKLHDAIRDRNVVHARTAILSYLDGDSQQKNPQALYVALDVAKHFTNPDDPFFDPENNRLEIPEKNGWDPAFLRKIKAALQINFSQEKLKLAEEVIIYLRTQGLRNFQPCEKVQSFHDRPNADYEKKNAQSTSQSKPNPPRGATTHHTSHRPPKTCHDPKNEFLAGAIVGGIALGGVGLLIGLIAGCAVKTAVGGLVIGGIAGGLLNQKKKRR